MKIRGGFPFKAFALVMGAIALGCGIYWTFVKPSEDGFGTYLLIVGVVIIGATLVTSARTKRSVAEVKAQQRAAGTGVGAREGAAAGTTGTAGTAAGATGAQAGPQFGADGELLYMPSVQGEERELYFITDRGTAKIGHRIEDKDRNVLYEAKVTHFTLMAPTGFDFIDHVNGTTIPHVVGHEEETDYNTILIDNRSTFTLDGDMLYYAGNTRTRRVNLYDKLFSYSLSTGKRTTLYGKNDRSIGELFVWDGQLYVHSSDMKTYGVNETANIYRVEEDGLKLVYTPQVSLYNSVIGDTAEASGTPVCSGDTYFTLASVEDHTEIFAFDKTFRQSSIYQKPGMICELAASEDRVAVIWQDWCHVAEILEMDRDGGNVRQITDLNGALLEGRYIAEPNRVDYESEGEKLHGWVLLPDGFSPKKKYPAILDVHGGPRCIYGETFFHEMQAWVAKGFVVFFTNIRGSDGRGDAFADIRGQYGGVDYKNLMDFTDAVLAAYPNIDQSRICETGGSYGGFMTNWIITHTDRFCAAASQRSISNWISMSFVADIGLYFDPDQCGAKDCFDFEKQWDHSPLKYVKNAKTPTLFIHSDEDYRCPVDQGLQMMNALAALNVETRIVVFHGENHELSRSGKPVHRLRRLNEITEWFVKHTS